MFDSISLLGVLGASLGITGGGVLIKIGKIFLEMFRAQRWGVRIMGRTIMMYTFISYIAIIVFAGGWITVFSMFVVEQSVIAIMASKIIIVLAGIAAVAVMFTASALLRRAG